MAIGSVMAMAIAQLLHVRLLMNRSLDRAAYAYGLLIVLSACLIAACVPALRASRVSPVDTLRHD
jgi:ABC-type antimicrobial peptide transport system permease subunit